MPREPSLPTKITEMNNKKNINELVPESDIENIGLVRNFEQ